MNLAEASRLALTVGLGKGVRPAAGLCRIRTVAIAAVGAIDADSPPRKPAAEAQKCVSTRDGASYD